VAPVESTVGVELTDNLSAGVRLTLGSAVLDGPFTGLTGATYNYALRGSVGLTYDLGCETTVGAYYQTKQNFNFDSAVRLALPGGGLGVINDIDLDLPSNVGIGVANESLFCGRLLMAMDVIFKSWDDTSLLGALWKDQWVYQFGAQYKLNDRVRLRLGYAYAENITEANPGGTAGGVTPPGAQAAIRYVQAQFAAINEHRISGGVGIKDMLPNVDFDIFAGGMLEASQQFGPLTSASVESYWIGAGLTWHFGGPPPCETCDECIECEQ
jgi:long-chain fatty acid transport protein